jgi:hypothetical protein
MTDAVFSHRFGEALPRSVLAAESRFDLFEVESRSVCNTILDYGVPHA